MERGGQERYCFATLVDYMQQNSANPSQLNRARLGTSSQKKKHLFLNQALSTHTPIVSSSARFPFNTLRDKNKDSNSCSPAPAPAGLTLMVLRHWWQMRTERLCAVAERRQEQQRGRGRGREREREQRPSRAAAPAPALRKPLRDEDTVD